MKYQGSVILTEDIFETEAFIEGVKKVGPGSEFRYRCIFDPTPVTRDGRIPPADRDGTS